jgi:GntR family transcriptional regulator
MSAAEEIVWRTAFPSPTSKYLCLCLARHSWKTGRVFPSYATIAKETGLSRSTVIRAMAELVEGGFVRKSARERPNGSQSSNEIVLTLAPVLVGLEADDGDNWGQLEDTSGGVKMTPPPQEGVSKWNQGGVTMTPPEALSLNYLSLSDASVREAAGEALGDLAGSPGIATVRDLLVCLRADQPCTVDEVYDGIRAAAAWFLAKHGPRSMKTWTLAATKAVQFRDARLAGLPAPNLEGRTHDQPASPNLDRRHANLGRALAGAESALARRREQR